MRKLLIATLLTVATTAHAATQSGSTGTLNSTAIGSAIPTTDNVLADGRFALAISAAGTAGTATFQCQQSIDGTNWTNVGSSVAGALGVACTIANPVGFYRVNVSAWTSGSFTFTYRAVNLK